MNNFYLFILIMIALSAVRSTPDCTPACKGNQDCVNGKCVRGGRPGDSSNCVVDRDCKPPLICMDGKCESTGMQVCRRPCGINEHCVKGQCVILDKCATIRCRDGFICKEGQCVPVVGSCTGCKPTQKCWNGKCVDKCYDVVCTATQRCENGVCVPIVKPCTELCKVGYECRNGTCVDKCDGVVCIATQRCQNGICVPIPCLACKPTQKCWNGKCVDKCYDVVCIATQKCQNGVCVPIEKPCTELCKIGYECRNGICVDKCSLILCPPGQRCSNGACVIIPCSGCKPTQKCWNGKCVDKCYDVVCTAIQRCENGICVPIDKCAAVTCPVGWSCKDGVCIEPICTKLCQLGYHCIKGQCVPITCSRNSQCPKGTVCRGGQCEIEINVCPANSQYVAKYCTQPRSTICPLIYAPACGVKADGSRVTYSNTCVACSEKSTVYTFNTPCYKAPFVCKAGESCLGYYCSSTGCKNDQSCPYDWQTCNSNKCVDKCTYLKCANCKYGICNYQEPSGACQAGKCRESYWSCYANQCVDLCSHQACPPNQVCKMGMCSLDPPSCPKCPAGYQCVKGACVPIKCSRNSQCPAGTICKGGQCELDLRVCPVNSRYQTNFCVDPRPTETTCPTKYYFVPPYPNYCGVKADGTRINFVEECSACKDTSIVYYFNTPCFKTPFVCKEGETCQNYYCSGKCSVDTECPYDWQNCVKNRCVDRCVFLKCANCKYGICNYVEPSGSCSNQSKCKGDYMTCLESKCADLCSHQACPPNYDCKNGACVKV